MGEGRGLARRDFFISYTSADRAWAEWIAWQLEAEGYTVVVQAWDFTAGRDWVHEMQHATSTAERVVAVLSAAYLRSAYGEAEWRVFYAKDPSGDQGLLLPVRVDVVNPPGLLQTRVYVDLIDQDATTARAALLAAARRARGKPTQEPKFPGAQGRSSGGSTVAPRFPGEPPVVWNVPHRRNPDLEGREHELAILARQLDRDPNNRAVQAIEGIGGVGKTALATEYAYRHRSQFDVVWWVRADEPATLIGDYAGVAAQLGLREAQAADQQAAVWAVRRWLEGHDRWLLILDNARSPLTRTRLRPPLARLIDLMPPEVTGQVLVTTRDRSWEHDAEAVPLGVLGSDHAVRFLIRRSGSDDLTAAAAVAKVLGYLALGLEQAGAFVRETRIPLSGYLDYFRRFPVRMLAAGQPRHRDPSDTMATTWLVSLEQVEKKPGALALLEVAAFLSPDAIPRAIFKASDTGLSDELDSLAADPVAIDEAVGGLRGYSLVEAEEGLLDVHPLLQQFVRRRLDDARAERRIGWAIRRLAALFPEDPHRDTTSWPTCERFLSHVLTAAEHAEEAAVEAIETGWLLHRAAVYLQGRGRYLEAKRLFERALVLTERSLPAAISTRLNDLGYLLLEAGDERGARDVLERALAIEQDKAEPDRALVGTLLDNLGHALLGIGDPGLARQRLGQALAIREAVLGSEHADVAVSLNNLGQALEALGQVEHARRHYERGLAIMRSVPGPDGREAGKLHNNLGLLLLERDDVTGAQYHLQQALTIVEVVLGPDHPDVAKVLRSLSRVCFELGDLQAARHYLDRAQAIDSRNLGGD
jgi:tetratricopeptide (TPR) repeat protein